MLRIVCPLVLLLLMSCVTSSEETRLRILQPDGSPATNATAYVWDANKHSAKQELKDADDGWLSLNDDQRNWTSIIAIKAPGTAVSIWPLGLTTIKDGILKLRSNVPIQGRVLDVNAKPMQNVQIEVIAIGSGSYLHIDRAVLQSIPMLKTFTDADGKYELPGIVLNDYDFPIGGTLLASIDNETVKANNIGSFEVKWPNQDDAANNPLLSSFDVNDIVMRPVRTLRGKLIDRTTNKPLAAVGLRAYFPHAAFTSQTDDAGAFLLEDVPSYVPLQVELTSNQFAHPIRLAEAESSAAVADELVFRLPTKRTFQATVQDATSLSAPLTTMEVIISQAIEFEGGWSATTYMTWGNMGPSGLVGSDGHVEIKIPSGDCKLEIKPHSLYQRPYEVEPITIGGAASAPMTISLKRNPGVLLQFNRSREDSGPMQLGQQLLVEAHIKGQSDRTDVVEGNQSFIATKAWGDQVDIHVMYYDQESQRRVQIGKTITIATSPESWLHTFSP
jgi:hypothetical protein